MSEKKAFIDGLKEEKIYPNYLYSDEERGFHISRFANASGEAGLYDSLSMCNRCGYCESVCPTYIMEKKEGLSARGRNQVIKMMVEGRIKAREEADGILFTCLLCGACVSACYAGVPTAEHVLEARRSVKGRSGGLAVGFAVRLLLEKPRLFSFFLKTLVLLKKTGVLDLLSFSGIFALSGLSGAGEAVKALNPAGLFFLEDYLRKHGKNLEVSGAKWMYFRVCGTNFIFPSVGRATLNLLEKLFGKGFCLPNACCGLIAYNYGNLEDARKFAMKNIEIFEKAARNNPEAAVIADCSSCAAFMKSYPSLFEDAEWRKRAAEFSRRVRDILEFIPEEMVAERRGSAEKVTYHDSCRACHGQKIRKEPRAALKKMLGGDFEEMPESDWCCGGAGSYFFTQKDMSDRILRRKIRNVASTGAVTVVAGSTSCLIQLGAGLKKYYPAASVEHYSVFMDKNLSG